MKPLTLVARLVFGAWMVANGINHFFLQLWPVPAGAERLAIQLMDALVHSGLMDVAMTIQLVTGVLILAGVFVPLALCVVMPISTCAVFWAVILNHQPLAALLALAAFALNGFLMLAYLDYYRDVLNRHALSLGESSGSRMVFDSLYVNPKGRTSRGEFVPALIVVLAVGLFYAYVVGGRTGTWSVAMVLFPAVILHARRLHDMGRSAWLLAVPALLMIVTFAIWLKLFSLGAQWDGLVPPIALAISALFAIWGCLGKGQAASNRFGSPVAA